MKTTDYPVIVAYGRTPICKAFKGSLRNENPIDYAAQALLGVLAKVPQLPPEQIDDAVVGCAFPEHLQSYNIARQIIFRAGLPDTVTAMTVSRICSSGLQAISVAANAIRAGERDVVVAGGVESMSTTVMYPHPEDLHQYFFENRPAVYDPPGITAEKVADLCGITREEMDSWAVISHKRAVDAQAKGWFDDQIIPTYAHDDDGNEILVTKDEGMRPDTSMETLANLKPAFWKENGRVTAGNAAQMSDGAGFVVLMSRDKARELNIRPIAEFVSYQTAGMDPGYMGLGPTLAVPKLLDRVGMTIDQIDVMELNEAFAAQVIPCIRQIGIDKEKVNPTGGALAYGHPLGATGVNLTCKVISYLRRTSGTYGIVTMCVGGGMGAAGLIRMLPEK